MRYVCCIWTDTDTRHMHLSFNTQYMSYLMRQCKQWTNLVLKCKLDMTEIQSDWRLCVRSGLFYWSVDSHQLIGSVLPPYSQNCQLIKQQLTFICFMDSIKWSDSLRNAVFTSVGLFWFCGINTALLQIL